MLANGGELEGARLLSPRTVDFMASNHLPGNKDMAAMGQSVFSEVSYEGVGFGLGVHVVLDPAEASYHTQAGEYGWGGMSLDPGTWEPRVLEHGPSLWGHDRTWLSEDALQLSREMRMRAAELGVREKLHVHDGTFDVSNDCAWWAALKGNK